MNIDIYNTDKKYEIIYADPPWQFNNKKTGGKMTSGSDHQYNKVMSINDLFEMPVGDLAADNCTLIMWYVGSMPQEALDLVKAWGFDCIKGMNGFTWNKLTKKGRPFFGMGFRTRAGMESAIIATKGKPKVYDHGVRQVRSAIVGKHSEKPIEFRDDIVKLCGDLPRIELFARKTAEGWDSFGDEL